MGFWCIYDYAMMRPVLFVVVTGFKINASNVNNNINDWRLFFIVVVVVLAVVAITAVVAAVVIAVVIGRVLLLFVQWAQEFIVCSPVFSPLQIVSHI